MCPSRSQQAYFPGRQKFRTGASGGPVTLNGHPQESPLCGMQEDTPVKWWPGPKGFPSPKPSLRSIYLNFNTKRLECINMPNFFFFDSENHFSNRILNKTRLKRWSWSEHGASKSPFCNLLPLPSSPSASLETFLRNRRVPQNMILLSSGILWLFYVHELSKFKEMT